jgi:microcompartment protein CcmL/EutN
LSAPLSPEPPSRPTAPALALLELCSVAQGVFVHDVALKRAAARVEWARVYNPGKYAILMRGGEEEVAESLRAARAASGEFEVDALLLPNAHPELLRALERDALPAGSAASAAGPLEPPALGVVECYSLCAALRAADAALKEAPVALITLRLDPTLGGKGCLILAGDLDAVDAALARARSAAGAAFLYHTQRLPRPHSELPLSLSTVYPAPAPVGSPR